MCKPRSRSRLIYLFLWLYFRERERVVVDERFEISKDLCCSAGMGWMYKVALINVHLILTVQFDILPHVNK